MYMFSMQYGTNRQINLKTKMSLAALKSFVHRLDYLTWMLLKVSHRIFTISFNKGHFFLFGVQRRIPFLVHSCRLIKVYWYVWWGYGKSTHTIYLWLSILLWTDIQPCPTFLSAYNCSELTKYVMIILKDWHLQYTGACSHFITWWMTICLSARNVIQLQFSAKIKETMNKRKGREICRKIIGSFRFLFYAKRVTLI